MPSLGTRVVPSLLARDLPKTVEVYRTVLGFRLTGEQAGPDGPTWVELSRDGVALMFYADPPHGTPTKPIMSGTLYSSRRRRRARRRMAWEGRLRMGA